MFWLSAVVVELCARQLRATAGSSPRFLTLTALAVGVFMLAGWVKRRVDDAGGVGHAFLPRFLALVTLLRTAITMPVLVGGVVLILEGFDLLPTRIMEIGLGLVAATGDRELRPRRRRRRCSRRDEPERRLLAMRDATARLMTRHLTWAARVLGTIVFINVVLRALARQCLAHRRDQHHPRRHDRGACSAIS